MRILGFQLRVRVVIQLRHLMVFHRKRTRPLRWPVSIIELNSLGNRSSEFPSLDRYLIRSSSSIYKQQQQRAGS